MYPEKVHNPDTLILMNLAHHTVIFWAADYKKTLC